MEHHNYNAFFYDDCEWYYHFHKNFEVICVLSGEVELTLNGVRYLLKADEFAMILPDELHAYHTPDTSRVWIGVFSSDFVSEFARQVAGKHMSTPIFTCEPPVRTFLLSCLITDSTPDLFLLKSALYAVCREFLRNVPCEEGPKTTGFIHDIITFVEGSFNRKLSLEEIARALGYEYHYLSRQFHRHFHINFKQFLNIYRINYAREQLLHTAWSITDIAHASGFQTVRTFNRVFAAQTGLTPSEFRAAQNTDNPFSLKEETNHVSGKP